MPLITIEKVPSSITGGVLRGNVDLSRFVSPGPNRNIQVLTFRWTNFAVEAWPAGWKPAAPLSTPVRPDGTWSVRVGPGLQYAALWVKRMHEIDLTGDEPFAAGTLPLDLCDNDSENYHVNAALDIVILSGVRELLSGVVTGLPSALEHPERLTRNWIPHEHELLKVVAWAKREGETKCVGIRRCDPSGYWSFPAFDSWGRRADQYAVAVATDSFQPTHDVPKVEPPVLALVWTGRSPLTTTVGGGS